MSCSCPSLCEIGDFRFPAGASSLAGRLPCLTSPRQRSFPEHKMVSHTAGCSLPWRRRLGVFSLVATVQGALYPSAVLSLRMSVGTDTRDSSLSPPVAVPPGAAAASSASSWFNSSPSELSAPSSSAPEPPFFSPSALGFGELAPPLVMKVPQMPASSLPPVPDNSETHEPCLLPSPISTQSASLSLLEEAADHTVPPQESTASTESAASGEAVSSPPSDLSCTVAFEGPISRAPTLTLSSSSDAGPFLAIFRDTHPSANGWIHGFHKELRTGYKGPFGGENGEYVRCHPPAGAHDYEVLVFDQDYELGPKLKAMAHTTWNTRARALGTEEDLIKDIAHNAPSGATPKIVTRCSVTVSHEQIAEGQ
ncbi:hypothetical protein TGGT1_290300 [Toxoplasma gondii GT1]|uniref:Phosphatidylethanolamine-binding protein n=2 Tax=Toxoplasma gondii TaxID=5811 RepID=S7W4D5_TOXGG|nr:hypothetical protein TGGT1_290300 [Toxoplasma gondii GT1]KAF4644501.1 hypothetical protein TGRH88_014950 [Toxoplasma gondii]